MLFNLLYSDINLNYIDLKFSMMCLNPGIGFSHLTRDSPRSFLLTSGTLAPFESFKSELFTDFHIEFVNSHVIDTKRQVRGPIFFHLLIEV